MRDLLVSYAQADRAKAEWIAATLRQAGHRVVNYREFPPGGVFVDRISDEIEAGTVVISVLSPAAQRSRWTKLERAAALQRQLETGVLSLISVRVEPCEPKGLYAPFTLINLVGLDEENAKSELLIGIGWALDEEEVGTDSDETMQRVESWSKPAGSGASPSRPAAEFDEGSDGPWGRARVVAKRDVMAVGALLLICMVLSFQVARLQGEIKALLQPGVATVATLTPLESIRRSHLDPLVSVQGAGSFITLVVFPLDQLPAGTYCLRFSTFDRRFGKKVCDLPVEPAGHLQLALPPKYLAPGPYRVELFQRRQPEMTLATYVFQLEERP